MFAAQNGHADTLAAMLAAGADVDHANQDGKTALHFAAFSGDAAAITSLMAARAELVRRDNANHTALDYAQKKCHADCIKKMAASNMTHLRVGDRVLAVVKQGRITCTVRFIGETKFSPGEWIGVETDGPEGKNDGEIGGTRYFECPPDRGLFVRRSMVRDLASPPPLPSVGENVVATLGSVSIGAIVRFVGETSFREGTWIGIETNQPSDKANDGTVNGVRYFECPPLHGLFIRPTMLRPDESPPPTSRGFRRSPTVWGQEPSNSAAPSKPSASPTRPAISKQGSSRQMSPTPSSGSQEARPARVSGVSPPRPSAHAKSPGDGNGVSAGSPGGSKSPSPRGSVRRGQSASIMSPTASSSRRTSNGAAAGYPAGRAQANASASPARPKPVL